MAMPLLSGVLWEIIEPILPPPPTPGPKGGRPPVGNRETRDGILLVLKAGIPREDLPRKMGCGSGTTRRRRPRDCQADGTWDEVHGELLSRLWVTDEIDWSRALIDSNSVRSAYGGEATGPGPVDRARSGSKRTA